MSALLVSFANGGTAKVPCSEFQNECGQCVQFGRTACSVLTQVSLVTPFVSQLQSALHSATTGSKGRFHSNWPQKLFQIQVRALVKRVSEKIVEDEEEEAELTAKYTNHAKWITESVNQGSTCRICPLPVRSCRWR
jgi:hypothetical protein